MAAPRPWPSSSGATRASTCRSSAGTPGLRATTVQRVTGALGGETDLVLATAMRFDDRAALDAGIASDAMRAAGRNLRDIAPGLVTMLVLEDADDLAAAGGVMDTGEVQPGASPA